MDSEYEYKVNPSMTYLQHKKSDITEAILGNIFRDYWANPAQREFILKKEERDRKVYEEKVRDLYDPENIFSKKRRRNNKNKVRTFITRIKEK